MWLNHLSISYNDPVVQAATEAFRFGLSPAHLTDKIEVYVARSTQNQREFWDVDGAVRAADARGPARRGLVADGQ